MQIPVNEEIGFPTLSATAMRRYGAGGFRLTDQEEARGCPRQWKAYYVDRRVPKQFSYPLAYGGLIHEVLYMMEEEAIGPEEALDRCFPPELEPEAYREALDDLTAYLERGGSPSDRFGTIAVEQRLAAELYVDEDFGPIWYQGIIDWIGIDLEVPNLLRVVDYKTNRQPPSKDDVRGDVQLKGYDWLVRQNWTKYMPADVPPRIAQHLDAIKWREVEVMFSEDDIDDWHGWAVAVARHILRDEKAEPVLNPGCAWCPVNDDCPAYLSLPDKAADLLGDDGKAPTLTDDVARLAWRDQANATRLLLEKAVKVVDQEFKDRALQNGLVVVGDQEFAAVPEWQESVDLRALHRALGNDAFYRVITAAKGKIDAVLRDADPGQIAAVRAAYTRTPVGTKVERRKAGE